VAFGTPIMLADMWNLSMKNPSDVRTLGVCAMKWLLFLGFWHLFPMLGAAARMGAIFILFLASFYVACMVHNSMHCDVFDNPAMETVWRFFLTATFGFPVEAYRPTHNANHHVFTQHEKDHLHTSQMKYQRHCLNLLLFFPTVYPGIMKLENEYVLKEFKKNSWSFYRFVGQAMCAHGTTLTIVWMDWRVGLLFWFLPNVLGVDGIITMNMLQHDGCQHITLGQHRGEKMEINNSRNFVGPITNWLSCNNGYHTIHHIHSNVHWSRYPEMHAKLVEPKMDPSLNERCLVRYLWRTYFWPGELPAYRQPENPQEKCD